MILLFAGSFVTSSQQPLLIATMLLLRTMNRGSHVIICLAAFFSAEAFVCENGSDDQNLLQQRDVKRVILDDKHLDLVSTEVILSVKGGARMPSTQSPSSQCVEASYVASYWFCLGGPLHEGPKTE